TIDTPHSGADPHNFESLYLLPTLQPLDPDLIGCFADPTQDKVELTPNSVLLNDLNDLSRHPWPSDAPLASVMSWMGDSTTDGIVATDSQNITTLAPFQGLANIVPIENYVPPGPWPCDNSSTIACEIHASFMPLFIGVNDMAQTATLVSGLISDLDSAPTPPTLTGVTSSPSPLITGEPG